MSSSKNSAYGSAAGMAAGAAIGTIIAPGAGTAIGASLGGMAGGSIGGMFGGSDGPDYSMVTEQFNKRQAQISRFAASLAAARARYMTSLGNMYNDAYARFSGNAEAGFASRGMSVNGGAFASTLAKEAGRMSFEGATMAAGMEREDLRSVDAAYGGNSGTYMSAISGGPGASFNADREDMRSIGSFASTLAMRAMAPKGDSGEFGSDGTYWSQNANGGYDKIGLGPSYRS